MLSDSVGFLRNIFSSAYSRQQNISCYNFVKSRLAIRVKSLKRAVCGRTSNIKYRNFVIPLINTAFKLLAIYSYNNKAAKQHKAKSIVFPRLTYSNHIQFIKLDKIRSNKLWIFFFAQTINQTNELILFACALQRLYEYLVLLLSLSSMIIWHCLSGNV